MYLCPSPLLDDKFHEDRTNLALFTTISPSTWPRMACVRLRRLGMRGPFVAMKEEYGAPGRCHSVDPKDDTFTQRADPRLEVKKSCSW